MKNIEILVSIREGAEKANLIIEDIEQRLEIDGIELADLISADDKDVYALLDVINSINICIHMLTEDIQEYMSAEVVSRNQYGEWCNKIKHDTMRLIGLMESFEEKHEHLMEYIDEVVRDYRILTQEGYGTGEE